MKLNLSSRPEAALTLFEVLVVVAISMIVGVLVLAGIAPNMRAERKVPKIQCSNNLKQVGLAYRIWEGDNNDSFPMGVSVTKGGALEMVQTGDAVTPFLVMSNELSTPKILYCPADDNRVCAPRFNELIRSNLSYFVGVDVTNEMTPKMLLSGDCNFEIAGKPVKAGLLSVGTNDPMAWGLFRHMKYGNLLLADGSVLGTTTHGLREYLKDSGLATNRLAIP